MLERELGVRERSRIGSELGMSIEKVLSSWRCRPEVVRGVEGLSDAEDRDSPAL